MGKLKHITLFVLLISSVLASAQRHVNGDNSSLNEDKKVDGQLTVNASIGHSFLEGALGLGANLSEVITGLGSYEYWPHIIPEATVYDFGADYGIGKRFIVGFTCAFQSVTLAPRLGNPYNEDEFVTRYNYGIRALFCFARLHKKEGECYVGLRAGISQWVDKLSPDINPYYRSLKASSFTNMSARISIGFRYYFLNNVGLHGEIGLGPPCIFEGGILFRFQVKKQN